MKITIYDYQKQKRTKTIEASEKADYEELAKQIAKADWFDLDTMGIFVYNNLWNMLAIVEFEKRERGVYMLVSDLERFEDRERVAFREWGSGK